MTRISTTARTARVFRLLNKGMLLAWRVGSGRMLNAWPSGTGRIMVLQHVGRRSGATYRTPLNYALADGCVWCVAGFGSGTDWYRNVLAEPRVEVWLPGRRSAGTAVPADDVPDRVSRLRAVLVASGFAAPLAGIRVSRLDDAALAGATAGYRLVKVVPDEPL